MDSINDISTEMKMLALEIGGNHHNNKESEKLLMNLVERLDKINKKLAIKNDDYRKEIMEMTGYDDKSIYVARRSDAIKYTVDEFAQ